MSDEENFHSRRGVEALHERTMDYAIRIIRLYKSLQKVDPGQTMARQVLRSGTSVGAHHREAHRAKSDADFVSKMEGALQELHETAYWLELLVRANVVRRQKLDPLFQETQELIAIFVTSVKRVKNRKKN